jgi:hypothetical protein
VSVSIRKAYDISLAANADLTEFVDGGLRLQSPGTSALHHLTEAHPKGDFVSQQMDGQRCRVAPETNKFRFWGDEQVFLLEHDWSSALQAVKEQAVDFRPPFSDQVFELKLSGKRICSRVQIDPADGEVFCVCFVWLSSAWVMLPLYDLNRGIIPDSPPSFLDLQWTAKYLDPIYDIVIAQIRGACIALDANIATTEIIKASPQIRKSRIASGKPAPYDFRVLTLKRRSTVDRDATPETTGSHVRLHFRRGHYRHFSDNSKTWINWTLVGDPDLGFIDKHYRLRQ